MTEVPGRGAEAIRLFACPQGCSHFPAGMLAAYACFTSRRYGFPSSDLGPMLARFTAMPNPAETCPLHNAALDGFTDGTVEFTACPQGCHRFDYPNLEAFLQTWATQSGFEPTPHFLTRLPAGGFVRDRRTMLFGPLERPTHRPGTQTADLRPPLLVLGGRQLVIAGITLSSAA